MFFCPCRFNIPRIINQLPNHIDMIGDKHTLNLMAVSHVCRGDINKNIFDANEDVQVNHDAEKQNNKSTKENKTKEEWETITKNSKTPQRKEIEAMKHAHKCNALKDDDDEAVQLSITDEEKKPNNVLMPPIAHCDTAKIIHESTCDNDKVHEKQNENNNNKNNKNKNNNKVEKEMQDEIEKNNIDEKAEDLFEEKGIQEEMKIEKYWKV